MIWLSLLCIGAGAILGASLRYGFGLFLNPLFPTMPLGTLAANLIGGFLMGIVMELTKNQSFLPELVRLGIVTGFLGALTTFSTFSAEAVSLLGNHEYLWTVILIACHLFGTLSLTICGIYLVKLFIT